MGRKRKALLVVAGVGAVAAGVTVARRRYGQPRVVDFTGPRQSIRSRVRGLLDDLTTQVKIGAMIAQHGRHAVENDVNDRNAAATRSDRTPSTTEYELVAQARDNGWPVDHEDTAFGTDADGAFVLVPVDNGTVKLRRFDGLSVEVVAYDSQARGRVLSGHELPEELRGVPASYHTFTKLREQYQLDEQPSQS